MTPIQLLTLGHTVRVCYDLTNYAELSINLNGDLTIHKLVGGSPKIIDNRETNLQTQTVPAPDRPLKVGDVLIYTDESDSFWTNENEYPIRSIASGLLSVVNDNGAIRTFDLISDGEFFECYKNCFTLKP